MGSVESEEKEKNIVAIVMPLPGRVPKPEAKLFEKMIGMGFAFNELDIMKMSKKKYLRYSMPEGWSFHDVCTFRPDVLVDWVFVDERGFTRIAVQGVWKGYYDCNLDIFELAESKPHVPPLSHSKESPSNK